MVLGVVSSVLHSHFIYLMKTVFASPCTWSCLTAGRANMWHMYLYFLLPTTKTYHTFLTNLDASSMSISTWSSRRLLLVRGGMWSKNWSRKKDDGWNSFMLNFCIPPPFFNIFLIQGLTSHCPWPYSGSLGLCLPTSQIIFFFQPGPPN